MNDNFQFYAFICILMVGISIGLLFGSVSEQRYYERSAVERGFAHFETAPNRTIKFVWHTNLTQVKP